MICQRSKERSDIMLSGRVFGEAVQDTSLSVGTYTYLPGYAIYLDMQSLKSDKSGGEFYGIPPQKLTPKLP